MIILNINRIVPNYTKKNINIHISKRFYPGGMGHVHKVVNALKKPKTVEPLINNVTNDVMKSSQQHLENNVNQKISPQQYLENKTKKQIKQESLEQHKSMQILQQQKPFTRQEIKSIKDFVLLNIDDFNLNFKEILEKKYSSSDFLEEKKILCIKKIHVINTLYKKLLKDEISLQDFSDNMIIYLKNRSNILLLTQDDFEIKNYIKKILKESTTDYETWIKKATLPPTEQEITHKINYNENLIFNIKNTFINEHNIQKHLQKAKIETCYLPEEYSYEINRLEEAINILKSNQILTGNQLLTFCSNIQLVQYPDAPFFKFSAGPKYDQKFYDLLNSNKSIINVETTQELPDKFYVENCLNENKFIVCLPNITKEMHNIPLLSGTDLHYSLCLPHPTDSTKLIRIAIFTSTKDENTSKLSNFQPNILKNNPTSNSDTTKKQYIRILNNFVIIDKSNMEENVLFTAYAKNDIIKIEVQNAILHRAKQWCQNMMEKPFYVHENDLRKMCILTYEKALLELKKNAEHLQKYLQQKSPEERKIVFKELDTKKEKEINNVLLNIYKSKLSSQELKLLEIIKFFDKILEKENQFSTLSMEHLSKNKDLND